MFCLTSIHTPSSPILSLETLGIAYYSTFPQLANYNCKLTSCFFSFLVLSLHDCGLHSWRSDSSHSLTYQGKNASIIIGLFTLGIITKICEEKITNNCFACNWPFGYLSVNVIENKQTKKVLFHLFICFLLFCFDHYGLLVQFSLLVLLFWLWMLLLMACGSAAFVLNSNIFVQRTSNFIIANLCINLAFLPQISVPSFRLCTQTENVP